MIVISDPMEFPLAEFQYLQVASSGQGEFPCDACSLHSISDWSTSCSQKFNLKLFLDDERQERSGMEGRVIHSSHQILYKSFCQEFLTCRIFISRSQEQMAKKLYRQFRMTWGIWMKSDFRDEIQQKSNWLTSQRSDWLIENPDKLDWNWSDSMVRRLNRFYFRSLYRLKKDPLKNSVENDDDHHHHHLPSDKS